MRWAKLILSLSWAASPLQHSILHAEQEDKVGAVQGRQRLGRTPPAGWRRATGATRTRAESTERSERNEER